MADYDNLQLSSDFTEQQYSAPIIPFSEQVDIPAGGAVTTINGDGGPGASGPVVSLTGGVTGYEFTAVGASITQTLNSVAMVLASLGLSKNNVAVVDPTVNDDSTQGYSVNSIWTETTAPRSLICQDASVGAAIWTSIT